MRSSAHTAGRMRKNRIAFSRGTRCWVGDDALRSDKGRITYALLSKAVVGRPHVRVRKKKLIHRIRFARAGLNCSPRAGLRLTA